DALHGEIFNCPGTVLSSERSSLFLNPARRIIGINCTVEDGSPNWMLRIQVQLGVRDADSAGERPVRCGVRLGPGCATHGYTGFFCYECTCGPVIFLQTVCCIGVQSAVGN